jgi:membrane protease YdiL (CAAX protease family)
MLSRPAPPGRPYPNLGQAVLLVLLSLVLQIATGATAFAIASVTLDDAKSAAKLIFYPWVLLPVLLLSGGLTLALGLRATREPAARFFRVHRFSSCLVPAILATSLGLSIVLHEVDNGIIALLSHLVAAEKLPPDLLDLAIAPVGAALLVIVAAPLLEEYLFRGLILRGLLENSRRVTAIIVSAVLFGVSHGNLRQFILAVTIGVTFGWWYQCTRSVGPGLIGHATFNSVSWLAAQLPAWAGRLGLTRDPHTVVHEPWWFFLVGVALTAVGVVSFNRHAFDLDPDSSWPPTPPAPDEPPLLEPPLLLEPTADQAAPDTRAAAPAS